MCSVYAQTFACLISYHQFGLAVPSLFSDSATGELRGVGAIVGMSPMGESRMKTIGVKEMSEILHKSVITIYNDVNRRKTACRRATGDPW
jgi:hypothetical protein